MGKLDTLEQGKGYMSSVSCFIVHKKSMAKFILNLH